MTYNSYINNKKDYLILSTILDQTNNEMIGGFKSKPKSKSKLVKVNILTTYMLTLGSGMNFNDIKLGDLVENIDKITKLGSFTVKDKVVIGDTDYDTINLKPGSYTAYTLVDSLMIIHDDLKIVPKVSDVKNWTWHHSKTGVGVDSGQFGFYDLAAIEFINKKSKSDNYGSSNNLPYIDCKNKNQCVDASIVDGSCISDFLDKKKIDDEVKALKPFGVISSTITGDGGFECFVIDNMRAILLGGRANEALFDKNEENENEK